MTRINCVPPSELSNLHLLAEYRELPRVFGLVRRCIAKHETPGSIGIPLEYTFGEGHVKFFYNKLLFLINRQNIIVKELLYRNFRVNYNNSNDLIKGIPRIWMNNWYPSPKDISLSRNRLLQKNNKVKEKINQSAESHAFRLMIGRNVVKEHGNV